MVNISNNTNSSKKFKNLKELDNNNFIGSLLEILRKIDIDMIMAWIFQSNKELEFDNKIK